MDKKEGKIKKFFSDFKAFITKGNILDLAVAVVIGAAFGKIITSLVDDIIMPLISLIAGGKAVEDWKIVIKKAVIDPNTNAIISAESAIRYGNFLQTILDFLIIAFFIFLALRLIINLRKRYEDIESELKDPNAKKRKAFFKEQRAFGYNRKQISLMYEEQIKREQQEAADKAAEEARQAAEAKEQLPPTQEELLAEIVRILQKNDKLDSK